MDTERTVRTQCVRNTRHIIVKNKIKKRKNKENNNFPCLHNADADA